MSKNVDNSAKEANLSPKRTKVASKIKETEAKLKEVEYFQPEINEGSVSALLESTKGTSVEKPNYIMVGAFNQRRTKKVPDGKVRTVVISEQAFLELNVRGLRCRFTWDEIIRRLIDRHLINDKNSDCLFED